QLDEENYRIKLNTGIELILRALDNIDILIVDLPTVSEEYVSGLKQQVKLLVNIDDNTTNLKFCSDILIRPNINEKVNHLYSGSTRYLSGRGYIILRKQFEALTFVSRQYFFL
ncbi:unnamed protein product, partial [marine sediment metagenome]